MKILFYSAPKITFPNEAWIKKDIKMFSKVVHEAAIVRECTGAVMEGKK